MSSYFFGGFSAYLIVPSGRRSNQSGCSLDPGMVGRGVQRDVDRDLQPVLARRRHQRVEILQRAELGVDRVHAALGRADGVGRADIVGLGLQRVVLALAVGPADRVDRREVEHVEAQVLHVGQVVDHVPEGAVPPAGPQRAGKELVPRREAPPSRGRPRPARRGRSAGQVAARAEAGHQGRRVRPTAASRRRRHLAAFFSALSSRGLALRRLDPAEQQAAPPASRPTRPGRRRASCAVSRAQVPQTSRQARIGEARRPDPVEDDIGPPAVVAQRGVIGTSRPVRHQTAAANTSCPSPKMSASIVSGQPATALAGNRPPSISCEMASMTMRDAARVSRAAADAGARIG